MSIESVINAAKRLKLTKCAHCNHEAVVTSTGRHSAGHGESTAGGRVGCSWSGCRVSVSFGGRDDAEMMASLIDAVNAWNTRVPFVMPWYLRS